MPKCLTLPVAARESRTMMNGRISSIRSPRLVNSNCILIDYCAGLVLQSAPDARFKVLGNVDQFMSDILLSVREVARKCSLAEKTIYCWIETGRLKHEHGLRTFGKRHRIDWAIFKACVDRGEFAGSDPSCS